MSHRVPLTKRCGHVEQSSTWHPLRAVRIFSLVTTPLPVLSEPPLVLVTNPAPSALAPLGFFSTRILSAAQEGVFLLVLRAETRDEQSVSSIQADMVILQPPPLLSWRLLDYVWHSAEIITRNGESVPPRGVYSQHSGQPFVDRGGGGGIVCLENGKGLKRWGGKRANH